MSYRTFLAPGVVLVAIAASALLLLSGAFPTRAVQNPSIRLDMITGGNSYSDPGAGGDNSMSVGTIDNCLTTAAPGNNLQHIHSAHLVIQNVEDLVAWQARFNYLGDQMRVSGFDGTPFLDNSTGAEVGFLNLPIDPALGDHRGISPSQAIPPAAPGPQTALIGLNRFGEDTFAVSPDTPAKAPPDDTSYSTSGGGILASVTLQVLAGNAGQPSLFMNLDDGTPNGPGSSVTIFNGSEAQTALLPPGQLGDGYHGEGADCVPRDCVNPECPLPPPDVSNHMFRNETLLPASGLHIRFSDAVTPVLVQNAPGCADPTMSGDHAAGRVDLNWGTPCVDSGESVVVEITSAYPGALASCFDWDLLGHKLFGDCDPS